MPMEFLREIAGGPFPVSVTGETSLDKLRVLEAAGMVRATLPGDASGVATVHGLTGLGRAKLAAAPHGARVQGGDGTLVGNG